MTRSMHTHTSTHTFQPLLELWRHSLHCFGVEGNAPGLDHPRKHALLLQLLHKLAHRLLGPRDGHRILCIVAGRCHASGALLGGFLPCQTWRAVGTPPVNTFCRLVSQTQKGNGAYWLSPVKHVQCKSELSACLLLLVGWVGCCWVFFGGAGVLVLTFGVRLLLSFHFK